MSKCEQCIIRQFSSLKTLSREELVKMSECKTSQIIKKGEVIFQEGDHLNGIFCVKDGVCKLTKLSANGKDQIVKFIKKGDLLGQRSVMGDEAVNLSAVALENMEVCFIPKEEVMTPFQNNKRFSMSMVKDLCQDLKEADDLIVNMAQKNVKQRVAGTLLYLEATFGTDKGSAIAVQLSREEIANIVGTATESAIRLLSEFKKEGWVVFEGKKIILKNKKQLQRISEGL
ncbi:Crp/Fnr family transcriptional regulator [Leptobacterium sp. I13]|uniref:Crp/Fnr family transcriptional regulator n=1 Tax=Leptobacterium meishanense TaxID=3128904 RepID=UPI0030EEAAE2